MDEVIEYTKGRFDNGEAGCNIYIIGYSLGGNHVLRYIGEACKGRLRKDYKIKIRKDGEP